ncbi:MAG: hypothetical protein MI867_19755, partial [Pseudomonadales bacterium]|nr:hypothetical protein [Pseudomonadales bacterium]
SHQIPEAIVPEPPEPSVPEPETRDRKLPTALIIGGLAALVVAALLLAFLLTRGGSEEHPRKDTLEAEWQTAIDDLNLNRARELMAELEAEDLLTPTHQENMASLEQVVRDREIKDLRAKLEGAVAARRVEEASNLADQLESLGIDMTDTRDTIRSLEVADTEIRDLRNDFKQAVENKRLKEAESVLNKLEERGLDVGDERETLAALAEALKPKPKPEPRKPPEPAEPKVLFADLAVEIRRDLDAGAPERAQGKLAELTDLAANAAERDRAQQLSFLANYRALGPALSDLKGIHFSDSRLLELKEGLMRRNNDALALARDYREGKNGAAQNEALSLAAVRLAADSGDGMAAFVVGNYFWLGRLVEQNRETAVSWYERGEVRGN